MLPMSISLVSQAIHKLLELLRVSSCFKDILDWTPSLFFEVYLYNFSAKAVSINVGVKQTTI
jgi:hypothetical protein